MDGFRWLTQQEQRAWRAYIDSTISMLDALDHQLSDDSGMPLAYYEILVRLSEAPGRTLRMGELAARTNSSRSRISHAVRRLEAKGWLARDGVEHDKRGQYANLTEAGFAALEAAAPAHVTRVRTALIDVLTPEQLDQLTVIGEAIIAGLRAP